MRRPPLNRFFKRYFSLKQPPTALISLTLVLLFLVSVRTPWLKDHSESILIETTGHIISLWGNLKTKTSSWLESYTHASSAVDRKLIQQLQEENTWLRHQAMQLVFLKEEKKALEKVLHIASTPQAGNFCTAYVLTSSLTDSGQMFFIKAGASDGLKKGQPVVAVYGKTEYIVGRIDAVSPHFSRVMLLTHPQFRIPVVGLHTGIQAILAGNGLQDPSLIYIKDEKPFPQKEIFVSSVQGGGFPEGRFVGELTCTQEHPKRFQTLIPWSQITLVKIYLDFPLFENERFLKNSTSPSLSSSSKSK